MGKQATWAKSATTAPRAWQNTAPDYAENHLGVPVVQWSVAAHAILLYAKRLKRLKHLDLYLHDGQICHLLTIYSLFLRQLRNFLWRSGISFFLWMPIFALMPHRLLTRCTYQFSPNVNPIGVTITFQSVSAIIMNFLRSCLVTQLNTFQVHCTSSIGRILVLCFPR